MASLPALLPLVSEAKHGIAVQVTRGLQGRRSPDAHGGFDWDRRAASCGFPVQPPPGARERERLRLRRLLWLLLRCARRACTGNICVIIPFPIATCMLPFPQQSASNASRNGVLCLKQLASDASLLNAII